MSASVLLAAHHVAGFVLAGLGTGSDDDFPEGIVIAAVVLIVVSVSAGLLGFRSMNRKRTQIVDEQRSHGHEPTDTV